LKDSDWELPTRADTGSLPIKVLSR
jgi:hypothetical protein